MPHQSHPLLRVAVHLKPKQVRFLCSNHVKISQYTRLVKKNLQGSPSRRRGVISVIWSCLKNGVVEYFIKHPLSIDLPKELGRQLSKEVYLESMHSSQSFWVRFRLHCPMAYTVALPPTIFLVEAAQKLDVFGTAILISDNNPFTAFLNSAC